MPNASPRQQSTKPGEKKAKPQAEKPYPEFVLELAS
jgi:hypothetical protein